MSITFKAFLWCSTSITLYFPVRCQMYVHSQYVIATFVLHSLCLPIVNLSSSPSIPPPAISPRVRQWHHRLTVRVMWLRMCLLRCVLCCRPITTTTGESIGINTQVNMHAYISSQWPHSLPSRLGHLRPPIHKVSLSAIVGVFTCMRPIAFLCCPGEVHWRSQSANQEE